MLAKYCTDRAVVEKAGPQPLDTTLHETSDSSACPEVHAHLPSPRVAILAPWFEFTYYSKSLGIGVSHYPKYRIAILEEEQ